MATYECYSHSVVKRIDPGFWFDIGKREVWFEYDAMVTYGIDANQLEISKPVPAGNKYIITVKMPKAQVFGRPALINDSIVVSAERRAISSLQT